MANPCRRKAQGKAKPYRKPLAAELVIAASPPVPRGGLATGKTGQRKKTRENKNSRQLSEHGINAFHANHLPLPRPVAPYSVVRTIQNFTLTGTGGSPQIWCFVPFYDVDEGTAVGAHKHAMCSFCGFKKSNTALSPATNGIDFLNLAGLFSATTTGIECVPAAMTVRLTCPAAMQGATGQFFLGRWSVAGDPRAYTTYDDMRSGFLSYGHPRPLTAARLAMRGVEVSSVARDMNICSDFLPLHATNSGSTIVTQGAYTVGDTVSPWPGFTPIFLIAESSVNTSTTLNIQVAIEWRLSLIHI